tara:strand:+ start:5477 stop:9586 length:4110 start_codon:yes stop_codon:yes gene_type:complete
MTKMTSQNLNIRAIAHPFSLAGIDMIRPVGMSVQDIVNSLSDDRDIQTDALVFINGEFVPCSKWGQIKPKSEAIVTLRVVPEGGGGKNPLKTVLSVALLAATPYLGAALGSGLATQFGGAFSLSITQKILAGGLNFAGRLAINALAPPSRTSVSPQVREKQTRFIQGSRNRIEPFGAVPQILGRHRMVPPLAAKPYTETVGNAQFLRMLFVWGYGPMDITDLKIGETDINEFDDIQLEHRYGYPDDEALTLYSRSVLQNDLNIKLENANGFEVRTTETDVSEISIDITFPKGLMQFRKGGSRKKRYVQVEVQYAPTGTNDWSAGYADFKTIPQQTLPISAKPGMHGFDPQHKLYAYRYYKRIDVVTIDKASGLARLIVGEKRYGYDENGILHPGMPAAVAPPVPYTRYAIANLHRIGTDDEIIVENRHADLPEYQFEEVPGFDVSCNDSTILIAGGGLRNRGFGVKANQTSALRKNMRFEVPPGQYDVRLRRITADSDDDDIFDEVFWSALRSIRSETPVVNKGLAMTALRIKASDQLNGTIDQFNGVVSAIIPDWDGQNWTVRATSNPASVFRHILQGPGNARPLADERLNVTALQEWHSRCASEGREYNAVIGGGQSVLDVLRDTAAAGRASPSVLDGKWSIVEDRPQNIPVQHFTPRNSWGFESERGYDERPHALRVQFQNRHKGWEKDERIVYDLGQNAETATRFETLDLNGVTDPDQAWRDASYHMASARLRPETYSFYADIEHIVCSRGDMIRLSHDTALAGLMSGRIKTLSVTDNLITDIALDADVEMIDGQSYVLRIRGQAGQSTVVQLKTTPGKTSHVQLKTPVVQGPNIQPGDLFLFGEEGRDSLELIVKSIEPQDDLSAKLTCVDAAPDLHNVDSGIVPEHQSVITQPEDALKPNAPVVENLQSGADAVDRHTDGSFKPQILITLKPLQAPADTISLSLKIRAKGESDFRTAVTRVVSSHCIAVQDVEEGEFYDIELRHIRKNSGISDATLISNYQVEGLSVPPEDVQSFNVSVTNGQAFLKWKPVRDIDLSHYRIKHVSANASAQNWFGATDMVPMVSKASNSITVPALSGYYLIKAVDLGGRESKVEAVTALQNAEVYQLNVVETLTESDHFQGLHHQTIARDGALQLTLTDVLEDWEEFDQIGNMDYGLRAFHADGVYEFKDLLDLGNIYTSRLTSQMTVTGIDFNVNFDKQDNVDIIENIDNSIPPEKWAVTLQISVTDDNPHSGGAQWSEWSDFVIGEYTARGYRFRILLESGAVNTTPSITNLSVTVDMPDRVVSESNVSCPESGMRVTFEKAFHNIPAIAVTVHDTTAGGRFQITNSDQSGFNVQFYDENQQPVGRAFDYLAKGYGQNAPA